MEIRRATADDLPAIMGMSEAFFAASGIGRFGQFSPEAMRETVRACMDEEHRALWVAAHDGALLGMLAMLLMPFWMAPSIVFAQELFWWVDPASRAHGVGRALLAAGEEWGRSAGACVFSMVALGRDPGGAAKIYERSGFELAETGWIRSL